MSQFGCFLTCSSFHYKREPLRLSTSNHLVLDLSQFKQPPKALADRAFTSSCLFIDSEPHTSTALAVRLRKKTSVDDVKPSPPPGLEQDDGLDLGDIDVPDLFQDDSKPSQIKPKSKICNLNFRFDLFRFTQYLESRLKIRSRNHLGAVPDGFDRPT